MINNERKKAHYDAFLGKSDYIPLIVWVSAEQLIDNTVWDGMRDPRKAISAFTERHKLSMQVKSDWIPTIGSGFVECLIPSLFGAKIYKSTGGYVDIKAFIKNIEETESLEVEDLYGGEMENAIKHLRYLKENMTNDVEVMMSRFMSPLDYAVMMRGGDFYLDLAAEPELSKKFMEKIMDVTIKVIKIFKEELKEDPRSQIAVRGVHFPGIRLTGDAAVNLSPAMIREYLFPIFKRFYDEFGYIMLHYCTLPAPAGHVLPTLTECPYVKCVDNWQGYRTFFDARGTGMMQDKIAFFADLQYEEVDRVDKLMTENPVFSDVPRKGGRGIVATVVAPTVDEGRRLYDKWVDYFIKQSCRL